MKRDLQGSYITANTAEESVQAFLPAPLPPDPPLVWDADLRDKFDHALVALGRLDAVSVLLPDTGLFLYMYVRK
ncbi:MAG: Fic family protein, partial [Candidatus Electrothrix sp. ATG1]|nr:Fic family protein [Candidatus Electrothrix sp. ATG1]